MRWGFELVGPVTASPEVWPPVPVSELLAALGIPSAASVPEADLQYMETLLVAAIAQAEALQGRDLYRKLWVLRIARWPQANWLRLREPLHEASAKVYLPGGGEQTIELVVYTNGWVKALDWPPEPDPARGIEITFVSGYDPDDVWWSGTFGRSVRAGILNLASHWYVMRGTPGEGGLPAGIERMLSVGATIGA